MGSDRLDKILSEVDFPLEDPRFYPRLYSALSKEKKKEKKSIDNPLKKVFLKDYEELSERVDESEIQESCSVRNILKTRELANFLVDDEGALRLDLIPGIIQGLKEHLYSLGPERQYDAKRNEHMVRVLSQLSENKNLARQIKTISRPYMHKFAEEVIRETLNLTQKTVVSDAHARRAALSAWLCYLRQNVGSCFATAPAIIVHAEQPSQFLKDLQEMLSTGRLKRTFAGVEYAVPFSYSWGAGDLRRVLLFQRGALQESVDFTKSPGLIAAFQELGLIDPDLSVKEKVNISKTLVLNVLESWEGERFWFYTSIEEILRKVLLNHLGIKKKDLSDYELRPKGMIHGSLLMAPQVPGKKREGVEKKCTLFYRQFKSAKDAFKELSDNALLKSWEFTLASFAETKLQFTTWNLYSSLGLKPEDKGGIGPRLYEILRQKLDFCNKKVEELQYDYEQAYNHLQYVQNRLKRASSEEEARWVKIEYQTRSNEFYSIEEMRNKYHNKARRYANLYNGLIDLYFHLFPNYFQEVYDADIVEVASGPFDDSPAGFRLLYKHGRPNTSQWTRIQNHTEFIEALVSFFTATETEIVHAPEMKGLEEDVGEIVTDIVSHIRSKEFIETAFLRMAKEHGSPLIKDPLEHLDKIEKKPWVYTSGGALTTLVSCYFRLEQKPKEVSRWVENPMELLVFLIDSIKGIDQNSLEEFVKDPDKSLLIHSPTHAFLLKPGYPLFAKGWKSKDFTYTWVRDNIVAPRERFVDKIYLDEDKMQFITNHLEKFVSENYKHYFRQTFAKLGGSMKAADYRQHILDTIELTRGLQSGGRGVLSADRIDSELYCLLPLFPSYQLKERVEKILSHLPGVTDEKKKEILFVLEKLSGKVGSEKTISAKGLQDIVKALLALVSFKTTAKHDYPFLISKAAQKEGYALLTPFIFADTNWVKDYFAFLVNPGNGRFELWRVDYTGSQGAPMSMWKEWLDGSKKKPDWGILIRSYEYSLV